MIAFPNKTDPNDTSLVIHNTDKSQVDYCFLTTAGYWNVIDAWSRPSVSIDILSMHKKDFANRFKMKLVSLEWRIERISFDAVRDILNSIDSSDIEKVAVAISESILLNDTYLFGCDKEIDKYLVNCVEEIENQAVLREYIGLTED